jgi:large subunit ribosomal protein L9
MEVILKHDVEKLGYADEIVKVKDGYARNYLLPQGLAIAANTPNRKMLAETIKQRSYKAEKIRKEAEFLAGKFEGLTLKIAQKASEKGTIFGSVNTIAVAQALKEQHDLDIDRKKIILPAEHIKELGNYTAQINIHKEIKVTVNLEVIAE